MNIVFVIKSVAKKNGTERTLTDKINYLANIGHDVTLVTYEQGTHPYAFPIDVKVKCVDFNCRYHTIYKYSLPRRLFESWRMKCRFRKCLRSFVEEKHPDMIITPTYTWEYMSAIMSVRYNTRIVIESHSAFIHDMVGGTLIERIRKHYLLRTIMCANLLIALTKEDADCWKGYLKNVLAVRNPLTFYPKELTNNPKIEGRILSIGRLQPQKRMDRLVEAFSLLAEKHPTWFVDIYGEGDEKNELQRQIDNLRLTGRINLMGVTSDVYAEYERSQFFVLSSDYEGYGLVLLEAMACGIPCVSTDCPFGPSDIIEDNVDGLLCKMDVKDLAEKMEWMITHEKERKEMGIQARQSVARYRKKIIMQEWEKAYLSVI